jgi:hypothetical protein
MKRIKESIELGKEIVKELKKQELIKRNSLFLKLEIEEGLSTSPSCNTDTDSTKKLKTYF